MLVMRCFYQSVLDDTSGVVVLLFRFFQVNVDFLLQKLVNFFIDFFLFMEFEILFLFFSCFLLFFRKDVGFFVFGFWVQLVV